MALLDTFREGLRTWLIPNYADLNREDRSRLDDYSLLQSYQRGYQRRQIHRKAGQADDNLSINWCGLVIERSVSMLLGDEVTFDLPGDVETPQDVLITRIWDANKQPILLHRLAQLGATFGTAFIKMLPDAGLDRAGEPVTKLVALNPFYLKIISAPNDMDEVVGYVQEYNLNENGEEVGHRIVTLRNNAATMDAKGNLTVLPDQYQDAWTETHYISSRKTGGRWEQLGAPVDWPWAFPPIHHWQNLPDGTSPYGLSDIDAVIATQDRYNANASHISKIIRYHAHPRQYVTGSTMKGVLSWEPDQVMQFPTGTEVKALEMASDLASSREFSKDLREALFTVTRTTDPSTVKDTIGALTNFGLRVLFKDELHKNNTKRQLYGDGLLTINHRLLRLANFKGEEADPGSVVWPDPLPSDDLAVTQALTSDIGNGLVSKQTASGLRDYDWESEQERMAAEQVAGGDVGAQILRAFGQGR